MHSLLGFIWCGILRLNLFLKGLTALVFEIFVGFKLL